MIRSARPTAASSSAPPVNTPSARGCGSGIAPFALYVVRHGAGNASQKARSHLASLVLHWRPAMTTGRLAAAIMFAARSRVACGGTGHGDGAMLLAAGT